MFNLYDFIMIYMVSIIVKWSELQHSFAVLFFTNQKFTVITTVAANLKATCEK